MSSETDEVTLPGHSEKLDIYEGVGTKMIAQAMVISALVQGMTVADAARDAGVRPSTVHSWKQNDEEFQTALLSAEEHVAKAIIVDGVDRAKVRVKELFPEAIEVFASELRSGDARIRLQAANAIARLGQPRQVDVKVGLEGLLRDAGPAPLPTSGD